MKKILFYPIAIVMVLSMFSSCDDSGAGEGKAEDSTTAKIGSPKMALSEKLYQLNVDCGDPADCDQVECEISSAIAHEFNEFYEFSDCITAYYGTKPIPPAKKVPASMIKPLVEPACDQYRIQYDLGSDSSTHSEIEFRIVKGYRRPAGETNSYTVAMFKGILARNPDTFHLYRGVGGQYGSVVTLMVMATRGPDTLYYGDLSDTFPMPLDSLEKAKK